MPSAQHMASTMSKFNAFTGLLANTGKSCVFLAGVEEGVANAICQTLRFTRGTLPVKYLGVPLISSQLKREDCDSLIDKISQRVRSWTSKFLSYAGRAQLIHSVLVGIQNYWASMFILPKYVLKQVEKIMR